MNNAAGISPLREQVAPARSGQQEREPERCAEVLLEAVASPPGLIGATLDTDHGELVLEYDPTVLAAHQADVLASQLSRDLGERYDVCTTRLELDGCDSCSRTLEKGLRQHEGTLSGFTVRPGQVAVETTLPPVVRAQVTRMLRQPAGETTTTAIGSGTGWLGSRLRTWDQTRWEVLLTAITGISIAVAWIGSALGLPQPWQLALYATAYLAGGYFGVREGLSELRRGAINVDLLMVLAAIGAATIGNWREGAILLFLFSLSNTLQDYAMGRSRRAIEALMNLRPEEALVKRGDREVLVRVEQLRLGEIVIVKPGERLPVDGTVLSGRSSVDQSTITGESMPVDVASGSQVFAGTVNQGGALEVEVTRLAAESTLARIIELVENAREEKAPTQRFLDDFEQRYALGVLAATALALVLPVLFLNQPFGEAFYRAMTLLVVASPCALVISVPAAILSAIASAARRGILFKGGAHLENLAGVKAVAFDKTGTLTAGKPGVTDIIPLNGQVADDLLALAAAVEARSEHPLARSIVREAHRRRLTPVAAEHFEAIAGRGARAELADGRRFLIGKPSLVTNGASLPEAVTDRVRSLESEGKTTILLGEEVPGGVVPYGIVAVADEPRPEARAAIDALHALGIQHIIMLTGDNEPVARAIAAQLRFDEYRAELLPEDKVRYVQELQAQYGTVAMVGDGVNDAPALAASGVGIAMGAAGTDVALETADVVLMSDELDKIAYVVKLSRRARRIVWQNIAFALGVIVVLVASNFLVGVPLPLGVVAHEGSTLVVVANGLRLLRG